MKILAIGDPHGNLQNIKKIPLKGNDLVLIPGDIGNADFARKVAFGKIKKNGKIIERTNLSKQQRKFSYMQVYNSTRKILKFIAKFAPTAIIYGNVESKDSKIKKESEKIGLNLPLMEKNLKKIKNLGIIDNKILNFNGIKIGGLNYFIENSWVKNFMPDSVKRAKQAIKDEKSVKKALKKFDRLDVLLCHQPPYGILDKVKNPVAPKSWQGKHAGSKIILDYIKKKQPKYVLCAHIHEGKGKAKMGKTKIYNLGMGGYKIITV